MKTYFTSAFMRLSSNDLLKGLVVAVLTAVAQYIYPILTSNTLPDVHTALYIGITAGLAYLVKNLFTPAAKVTTPVS